MSERASTASADTATRTDCRRHPRSPLTRPPTRIDLILVAEVRARALAPVATGRRPARKPRLADLLCHRNGHVASDRQTPAPRQKQDAAGQPSQRAKGGRGRALHMHGPAGFWPTTPKSALYQSAKRRRPDGRSSDACIGERETMRRSIIIPREDVMQPAPLLDCAVRRRSPATLPGHHRGRSPRNRRLRYPPDPPTVQEIIAVMRGGRRPGRAPAQGADGGAVACWAADQLSARVVRERPGPRSGRDSGPLRQRRQTP